MRLKRCVRAAQDAGQLPFPFLPGTSMPGGMPGGNFMGAMSFLGQFPMQPQLMQMMQQAHMQQMQQQIALSGVANGRGQSLDGGARKRSGDGGSGSAAKKGRKARNENKARLFPRFRTSTRRYQLCSVLRTRVCPGTGRTESVTSVGNIGTLNFVIKSTSIVYAVRDRCAATAEQTTHRSGARTAARGCLSATPAACTTPRTRRCDPRCPRRPCA